MTLCQVLDLRAPYQAPEGLPQLELGACANSDCSRRSPCHKLSALTLRLLAFETDLTVF